MFKVGIMKRALLLIITVTLLFSGCVEPRIEYVKNSWGEVNEEYTEMVTKVGVHNPLPVPLPVKDIKIEIFMNGIKMGQGSAVKADIGANTISDVVISTKIDNDKIVEWWVSHVKNNEVTNVDVKGKTILDILSITQFDYPVEYSSKIKTQILDSMGFKNIKKFGGLLVEGVNAKWDDVSKDHTEMKVNVKFKTSSPIRIVKLRYYIELNGIKLADGVDNVNKDLESSKNVEFSVYIDNSKIPRWWVSHIKNGERSVGKIVIKPVVEIAGSEYKIPLIEQSINLKTNMFGE